MDKETKKALMDILALLDIMAGSLPMPTVFEVRDMINSILKGLK